MGVAGASADVVAMGDEVEHAKGSPGWSGTREACGPSTSPLLATLLARRVTSAIAVAREGGQQAAARRPRPMDAAPHVNREG
jgi:hypothetical protein